MLLHLAVVAAVASLVIGTLVVAVWVGNRYQNPSSWGTADNGAQTDATRRAAPRVERLDHAREGPLPRPFIAGRRGGIQDRARRDASA